MDQVLRLSEDKNMLDKLPSEAVGRGNSRRAKGTVKLPFKNLQLDSDAMIGGTGDNMGTLDDLGGQFGMPTRLGGISKLAQGTDEHLDVGADQAEELDYELAAFEKQLKAVNEVHPNGTTDEDDDELVD